MLVPGAARSSWSRSSANRFLEMMSELAVGWLLLERRVHRRTRRGAKLAADHPDRAFYEGKSYAPLYYARNVLPSVEHGAQLMALEDATPMEITDAAFASAVDPARRVAR